MRHFLSLSTSGMKVVRVKVPSVRPSVRCSLKRLLRTMPSVVLLVFVVGLIFLTLMQIAVIHANRKSLQRDPNTLSSSSASSPQQYPNSINAVASGSGSAPLNSVHYNNAHSITIQNRAGSSGSSSYASTKTTIAYRNAAAPGSGNGAVPKTPEVVRVEAFVDRNAPTVEANMAALRSEINVAKIRQIVAFALKEIKRMRNRVNRTLALDDKLGGGGNKMADDKLENVDVKKLCPSVPPNLSGRIKVNLNDRISWDTIRADNPRVRAGGVWWPDSCKARHRIAVIIPYRDREEHLATLLAHLYPILQRQQTHFKIFVVEQFGNDTFNKGVLMNAGVREALKEEDFHCFVFHDVDMIPEDDRNMYTCPQSPRHLSVAVDKFNYSLPYVLLVGGVFAIKTEQFATVNGYSNLYWGWGGEDDDIAYRIKFRKLPIIRPPESIGRYSMIKHEHRAESPNNVRSALLRMSKRRCARDGLNSVKYKLVSKSLRSAFTHLMIDIGQNHRWKFVQGKKLIISF